MAKFRGAILRCIECGKDFRVPPVRKDVAKYCSKECADIHRHDATRIPKHTRNCPVCGNMFEIYPCHEKRRKFCSYECAHKEYSERWKAVEPNQHFALDNGFYSCMFWSRLRLEILERDEHHCRDCGAKRGLHVHHIKIRKHGGGDAPDNLITLCNKCHQRWHAGQKKSISR